MNSRTAGCFSALTFIAFLFAAWGCGTVQEGSEEWSGTPPISVTARLEYRIDSLMNENRRLKQQLEAMATENRNLTARNAELETRLKDATAMEMKRPTSEPQPQRMPTPPPSNAPRSTVNTTDLSAGYADALALCRKRNFAGAVTAFQTLIQHGIQDNLADNCHYWIGESYYGMSKYADAIASFTTVLGYRDSEKKDDAQLMIGNCYSAQGKFEEAKEAYRAVMVNYPHSPLARKAQEKIGQLQ